jgi:hypothetical protein
MLYQISVRSDQLTYKGGQNEIIHLEADLHKVISWADRNKRRWAFTLSNAGAYLVEDRASLHNLNEIDWSAVAATNWQSPSIKHSKQAEFLVEKQFPWKLIESIGTYSQSVSTRVSAILNMASHQPQVQVCKSWYY